MTAADHMSDPRRRYPDRPVVDDTTDAVLEEAVTTLILLRSPMWHGDAGASLHALASLHTQITERIPDAVIDSRDQDYTWAEIGELLGLTPATAQRRYAHHRRPPIDND
jgi:hypothetical protein